MNINTTININQLVGEFLYLEERWLDNPAAFSWPDLKALADAGAFAYNEGKGPAFHILALDGLEHGEFHENFLKYSLAAGFDPFKVVHTGTAAGVTTVINHKGLAESAIHNPSSARMQEMLKDAARERFTGEGTAGYGTLAEMASAVALCADSIPADLQKRIMPVECADL